MNLGLKTIKELTQIINEKSQYRKGSELVDFFNALGFHDCYGPGFPSRYIYTEENIKHLNGTSGIDECIKAAFAPNNFIGRVDLLYQLVEEFNKHLAYDGWNVVVSGNKVSFRKVNFGIVNSSAVPKYPKCI